MSDHLNMIHGVLVGEPFHMTIKLPYFEGNDLVCWRANVSTYIVLQWGSFF